MASTRYDAGNGWTVSHNLKVVGSNPTPATNDTCETSKAPAAEVFAFQDPFRRDRWLRPPAPNKPLISLRISGAFLLGVGRNFQIGSILEADGGVSFCRNVQLTGVINRCAEICNSPGAAAE